MLALQGRVRFARRQHFQPVGADPVRAAPAWAASAIVVDDEGDVAERAEAFGNLGDGVNDLPSVIHLTCRSGRLTLNASPGVL